MTQSTDMVSESSSSESEGEDHPVPIVSTLPSESPRLLMKPHFAMMSTPESPAEDYLHMPVSRSGKYLFQNYFKRS